jgi:hypothetical protein
MLGSFGAQVAVDVTSKLRGQAVAKEDQSALRRAWEKAAAQGYREIVDAFLESADRSALPDQSEVILRWFNGEAAWSLLAAREPRRAANGLAEKLGGIGSLVAGDCAAVLDAFVKFAAAGGRFATLVELRLREELQRAAGEEGTAVDLYLAKLQEQGVTLLAGQTAQLETLTAWTAHLATEMPKGFGGVVAELAEIRRQHEAKERLQREVIQAREDAYLAEVERLANKQWFGLETVAVDRGGKRPDLLDAYISMRGTPETPGLRELLAGAGGLRESAPDLERRPPGFPTVRLLGTARRLVLLGHGGDGKSAFAAFLAVACARSCKGGKLDGLEAVWEEWPVRQRLCVPFFLRLRDFSAAFGTLPGTEMQLATGGGTAAHPAGCRYRRAGRGNCGPVARSRHGGDFRRPGRTAPRQAGARGGLHRLFRRAFRPAVRDGHDPPGGLGQHPHNPGE